MRTASAPGGLKTAFLVILPLSLAFAFMLAGIGTALWPPLTSWAAPLACAGEVEIRSDYYTTPSGGSGVQRHVACVSGAPGAGAVREDITMMTIGIAFLAYAAIIFVLLQLFAAPRIRRRAEARGTWRSFGGGVRAQGVGSPAELEAILAQVAGALRSGEAEVNVRTIVVDAPGGTGAPGDDPAERLARLRQLHEAGLIGDAEFAAKKAEILAGL